MAPAGLAAYARRTPERSGIYSFEREKAQFDAEQERAFRRNKPAWEFFQAQPPYYRNVTTAYVTTAKKPETRQRRLADLIACSGKGERLHHVLSPPKAK
jgi:hypothetical protein